MGNWMRENDLNNYYKSENREEYSGSLSSSLCCELISVTDERRE